MKFLIGPRRLPLILVSLLASALAGCFGGAKNVDERCNDVAEYQASRTAPGVQVPEGLAAPGKGTTYAVPPDAGADVKGAACLARPPPYFRPEPAAAPAAEPAGD